MGFTLETEKIPCNFCGSENHRVYDELDGWKIVCCSSCGFCFTNERPTIESLPYFYQEDYFKDERHSATFYNEDGTVRRIDSAQYQNRVQDIEHYFRRRGSLLELGAARGEFLTVMENRGWDVHGVEISEDAVKLAKELYDLDLKNGVFSEFDFDEQFDVVCMYQTLEHVPDPKEVIEKSYSVLKPGGIVVIEVPNLRCYDLKRDEERKRLSYDLPRHLNHFDDKFLKKAVENVGFEVVEINLYYPNFILERSAQKAHQANNAKPAKATAAVSQKITTPIPMATKASGIKQKVLDNLSKFYPGWRVTVIGRK